jgi:hypothetical protein
MFTRNFAGLLVLCAVGCACAATPGCSRRLDPQEYGEVITEVPQDLGKPFPLPELEVPAEGAAQPAAESPEKSEPSAAKPAE